MALSRQIQLSNRVRLLPANIRNSILYHDVFNFPLKKEELVKWQTGERVSGLKVSPGKFVFKKGFYFLKGKEDSVYRRLINEKFSKAKLKIAWKAVNVLSKIPSVKMVGVTGSLAMMNASEGSDIDLMIITATGTLWTTRLISYLLLFFSGLSFRRSGEKEEKDKLCTNIWLDETDLKWTKKNIFTAHEVVQLKPLLNKNFTYEKFIRENAWARDYWPNAMKIKKVGSKTILRNGALTGIVVFLLSVVEPLSFWFEYQYMRNKITKEKISPSRAVFHPFDWSRFVNSKIKPR